jgi:predicted MFS family arabinose efflux permease
MVPIRPPERQTSPFPPDQSPGSVRQATFYFLLLLLLCYLGAPGSTSLSFIPIRFLLKDRLRLTPEQIASFSFVADTPFYISPLLGLLRDRWQPLGGQDRGYMVVLPPAIACAFFWLAFHSLTYGNILVVLLCGGVCGVLLLASIESRIAATAQRYSMTGKLAVIIVATAFAPGIIGALAGGWLTAHVAPSVVFLIAAAVVMPVALMGLWRPRAIYVQSSDPVPQEPFLPTISRVIHYRPLYLPSAILFLWVFTPGWKTPLFFYLTHTRKLSSEVYGTMLSIEGAFIVLFVVIYSQLCGRLPLKRLLWIGTIMGILGGPLYWFIRTPIQAYEVGALVGISCGLANTAFIDLMLRSCPDRSEGIAVGLAIAAVSLASNSSDIVGGWLYSCGGFGLALAVTVLVTCSLLIPLNMVPAYLTTPCDGEPINKPEQPAPGCTDRMP